MKLTEVGKTIQPKLEIPEKGIPFKARLSINTTSFKTATRETFVIRTPYAGIGSYYVDLVASELLCLHENQIEVLKVYTNHELILRS